MPTISFTLSAADAARVVAALSVRFGYSATLPDGSDNPQSPAEFVRLRIAQWVKSETRDHELKTAQAAVSVTEVTPT